MSVLDEYLVDPKVSLLCQQQVGNALEIVLLKRDDVLFGQAVARRLGITHADLECLDMIFVRGRVTAGEIAAASGLTTGAVTGVIDRLERAKLVRRERDAVDRRKVYVKVLPAAPEGCIDLLWVIREADEGAVDGYTSDQLSFLIDYFVRSREIIVREIQKLDEKAEQTLPRKRSPAAQRRSSAHIGTEPGN